MNTADEYFAEVEKSLGELGGKVALNGVLGASKMGGLKVGDVLTHKPTMAAAGGAAAGGLVVHHHYNINKSAGSPTADEFFEQVEKKIRVDNTFPARHPVATGIATTTAAGALGAAVGGRSIETAAGGALGGAVLGTGMGIHLRHEQKKPGPLHDERVEADRLYAERKAAKAKKVAKSAEDYWVQVEKAETHNQSDSKKAKTLPNDDLDEGFDEAKSRPTKKRPRGC